MPTAPFPVQPELTAIALAYKNKALIADSVLPRVPVEKQVFKYLAHDLAEGYTVPDTLVGRKSEPNQVEFSATETTSATEDYGLDDVIPLADVQNAAKGQDPVGRAVEGITSLIELGREIRVAAQVFNAANYAAANKVTLSGTSQFSDFANSDPIAVISDGLDAPVIRPNVMVIGQPVYSMLRRHPKIVKALHGNAGDSGVATRLFLAELFEVEEVLVGEAFMNTAKKGQAAALARTWGKHVALIHRNKSADTRGGVTFGITAQFGQRIAGQMALPKKGLRGSVLVRAGESVKELVIAPDAGYFIQNAVA